MHYKCIQRFQLVQIVFIAEPHTHIGKKRKHMNGCSHGYHHNRYFSWARSRAKVSFYFLQAWFISSFFDIGHPCYGQ